MKVGERLRQIRIHKGFTQSELVEGICSVTYISRIEGGKAKPSERFIGEVAVRLGVPRSLILEPDSDRDVLEINRVYGAFAKGEPLPDSDLSFLEMTAFENHPPEVFYQIYAMLIGHFNRTALHSSRTEELVRRSENLLPEEPEDGQQAAAVKYFREAGRFYYSKQQYEKAYQYEQLIEKHLPENCRTADRARNYYNLALVRTQIDEDSDLEMAIHYGEKALGLYRMIENKKGVADCLTSLAIMAHRMEDYDKALSCLDQLDEEALSYLADLDIETDGKASLSKQAVIDYNYGRIHQKTGRPEKALCYFEKSLDADLKAGNEHHTTSVLTRLAELYASWKDWEKTQHYLEQAYAVTERHDLPNSQVLLLHQQAGLHKVKGDEPAYEKEMQKAVQLAMDWKYTADLKEISTELADHYYGVRAYKMAAKYYRIALEKDS